MSAERVVLITGTRKGIGRFLAERCLGRGMRVVGCSRQPSDLRDGGYRHHCLDICDEDAVKQMVSSLRKEFGRLDVLINNAGIASMNHLLLTPLGTARRILETNVLGTFLLCREAAKVMQKRRYGRVINFTSVAVPLKLEGEAVYAASKAAVITLTEVLARELGPLGVTVNAVGPTPIATELIGSVPKETIDALVKRQAIRRLGTFDDVANVVDFFMRPESEFVTGQTLFLGGV